MKTSIASGLLFIAVAAGLAATIVVLMATGQAGSINLFRFGFFAVLLFGTGLFLVLVPTCQGKAKVE